MGIPRNPQRRVTQHVPIRLITIHSRPILLNHLMFIVAVREVGHLVLSDVLPRQEMAVELTETKSPLR